MKQALVVGGLVLGGGAAIALAYVLTRPKSGGGTSVQPPQAKSSKAAPSQADLTQLLDDTASTRSGPDYEYDIYLGGWGIHRDRTVAITKLGKGSIVRLTMYPTERKDSLFTFGVQITEAIVVGGFTIYKGKWVTAPGGLDPNEIVAFTSSDIASVAKAVPR